MRGKQPYNIYKEELNRMSFLALRKENQKGQHVEEVLELTHGAFNSEVINKKFQKDRFD